MESIPVKLDRTAEGMRLADLEDFQYKGTSIELAWRLKNAKPVFCNTPAIENVFHVAGCKVAGLDLPQWLTKAGGVISTKQQMSSYINPDVPIIEDTQVKVLRIPGAGRTVIIGSEIENGRFIVVEAKGAGIGPLNEPRIEVNKNGVMYLHDAIYQFIMQFVVDKIFECESLPFFCAPALGILSSGYEIKHSRFGKVPAGVLVRPALIRNKEGTDIYSYRSLGYLASIRVESILRKYGLTSTSKNNLYRVVGDQNKLTAHLGIFDRVVGVCNDQEINNKIIDNMNKLSSRARTLNVQFTNSGVPVNDCLTLVDFEQYIYNTPSDIPTLVMAYDKPLAFGTLIPDSEGPFAKAPLRTKLHRLREYDETSFEMKSPLEIFGGVYHLSARPLMRWCQNLSWSFYTGSIEFATAQSRIMCMIQDLCRDVVNSFQSGVAN